MPNDTTQPNSHSPAGPRRELTLLDATSIAVGIIIGSAIYRASPAIIKAVPNLGMLMLVWLGGALIALFGALTYAELASTYPEDGGDYIYLRRAFGRRLAFVYAWSELLVIRPGSLGAMAYVFANYFEQLFAEQVQQWVPTVFRSWIPQSLVDVCLAVAAILAMAAINWAGVRQSKWTQYVLTSAKLIGLFAIFIAAMFGPGRDVPSPALLAAPRQIDFNSISLAMIFVVFAYGGWNDIVFVAAETYEPRRNIPRALLLALAVVAVVYLAMNFAFVHTLGYEAAAQSETIAADVLKVRFGGWGDRFVSALICVSALGAINGMIFTRSRIYTAVGRDYPRLAKLATWNSRTGAPERAIALQTVATLIPVIGFGLVGNGFESMVIFTHPVFWFFFFLVGLSLYVLRCTDPAAYRPYRVVGYPIVPALFCLSCIWMCYSAVNYAIVAKSYEACWSIAVIVFGFAIAFWPARRWRGT